MINYFSNPEDLGYASRRAVNPMSVEREVEFTVKGAYQVQVLENGEVVGQTDKINNYIYNWGLNQIGSSKTWAQMFEWCRVGNMATGSLVEPSGNPNSPVLQSEVRQSNTYYTGNVIAPYDFSGCGTSGIGVSGLLMRRTFDFPAENGYTTYTEIGWAPASAGNLFSRILTKSGGMLRPVEVLEGQSLRVIYELQVTMGPSGLTSAQPITGWESAGQMGVQLFGLSSVSSSGTSTFWDAANGANEPSVNADGWISSVSTDLAPIGQTVNRSGGTYHQARLTLYPYTQDTFERRKRFFIPSESGVFNGYRSLGVGPTGASGVAPQYNSFAHVLDSSVNKEYEYILNLHFLYKWARGS